MNPPSTQPPESFKICEGYASYCPVGSVSLEKAVDLVTTAIRFARDHNIRRLLVDATRLTGFPSPSLAERYWIARQWATESKKLVEAAFALQSYLIEPERFGIKVATNLGMRADVFDSTSEALAWLLSGAKPQPFITGNQTNNSVA